MSYIQLTYLYIGALPVAGSFTLMSAALNAHLALWLI